jgi:hypothetical protein
MRKLQSERTQELPCVWVPYERVVVRSNAWQGVSLSRAVGATGQGQGQTTIGSSRPGTDDNGKCQMRPKGTEEMRVGDTLPAT